MKINIINIVIYLIFVVSISLIMNFAGYNFLYGTVCALILFSIAIYLYNIQEVKK